MVESIGGSGYDRNPLVGERKWIRPKTTRLLTSVLAVQHHCGTKGLYVQCLITNRPKSSTTAFRLSGLWTFEPEQKRTRSGAVRWVSIVNPAAYRRHTFMHFLTRRSSPVFSPDLSKVGENSVYSNIRRINWFACHACTDCWSKN